ncbi:MAG: hypothetical protein Q8N88_01805 [Nanoarchaeota archaeon]|nr:hypothetical protein [Nanoarchaeota archaeon]
MKDEIGIIGVLYRKGAINSANAFYWWRICFRESEVPTTEATVNSDFVKRYNGLTMRQVADISDLVDEKNTKDKLGPESKLLRKIEAIIHPPERSEGKV